MSKLTFKRDPILLAFAALIVVAVGALIFHGDVTFKEGAAFVAGALALPGLFGAKEEPTADPPVDPEKRETFGYMQEIKPDSEETKP